MPPSPGQSRGDEEENDAQASATPYPGSAMTGQVCAGDDDWVRQAGARLVGEAVLEVLNEQVQAVGGMTMGADPIGVATAIAGERSGRPLRALPDSAAGFRPQLRPCSLRSRRPNWRVQPTLWLVRFAHRHRAADPPRH